MFCPKCGNKQLPEARFCAACGARLQSTAPVKPSQTSQFAIDAAGDGYAGFWMRFVAWIIDQICVALGLWGIFSLLRLLYPATLYQQVSGATTIFILLALYYVILTAVRGQTVGKIALGIRVVGKDGEAPGLGYAVLREVVGKFISAIALFLGFLWIGCDKEKQGWHDKIAGTRVIKIRNE